MAASAGPPARPAYGTDRRWSRPAALLIAVALVAAGGWARERIEHDGSGSEAPSSVARTLTVQPESAYFAMPLRFIAPTPSDRACRSRDLSLHAVTVGPPDPSVVATVAVTSERVCQISGLLTVTPLNSRRRAAAGAVVLDDSRGVSGPDDDMVTVSPGHVANLWIDWWEGQICPIDRYTAPTFIATAFSFDLNGARGVFRLSHPVAACPMAAGLDSTDINGNGSVEFAPGDATRVAAGGRYQAGIDLRYLDTATAVLDPCPTIWARITPQSAAPVVTNWRLACAHMAPVAFGDAIALDLPLEIPASWAAQFVDIDVGLGQQPYGYETTGPMTSTVRVWVSGDHPLSPVPFVALPAPPLPAALRRTVSPPCDVRDLVPADLDEPGNGAGGQVFIGFSLRNRSPRPCTLANDIPIRLTAPGQDELTVPITAGGPLLPRTDGELEAGATTIITLAVGSSCGIDVTGITYTAVNVELPDGVLVVPFPVDDRCGVGTPGLGVTAATEPDDSEIDLVNIDAPPFIPRGRPTTIQVTLESFEGTELPALGYAVTVAGSETDVGLATDVQRLLPQLPVIYEIQVDPAVTLPPGPTQLRFEILNPDDPGDQVSITLT